MRVTCDALDPDGQLPNQEARDIAALRQPPSQQLTDRQREILRLADELREATRREKSLAPKTSRESMSRGAFNAFCKRQDTEGAYLAAALLEDK